MCMEEQQQLCGECAEKHKKSKHTRGHTLIDLRMCVNESRSVLSNLELEVIELIKDTETNSIRGKTLIEMIETRKARYRESQEQKLERTIQVLKAQLECNVKGYEEAVTQKFSHVFSTTQRSEKQVREREAFLEEIRTMKKIFGKHPQN